MGKLLRLDQWNFYTKNVNHITTIEKWFEITDWLHLEIESFYFSDFEIEHGVFIQMNYLDLLNVIMLMLFASMFTLKPGCSINYLALKDRFFLTQIPTG